MNSESRIVSSAHDEVRVGGVEDGRPDIIGVRGEGGDAGLGRHVPQANSGIVRGGENVGVEGREFGNVDRSALSTYPRPSRTKRRTDYAP